MLRSLLLAATLSFFASLASAGPPQELAPLQNVRACAEHEPAPGVLVTYPTALPFALLAEVAEDDVLYVMIDAASEQASVASELGAKGVDLGNVEFLVVPTDSIWTRDWSGRAGFQNGQHALYMVLKDQYDAILFLDNVTPREMLY